MDVIDGLKLMQEGKKITHILFMSNEYIFIDPQSGVITTEDGYNFSSQFWKDDKFADGWSEYQISDRRTAMEWWNNLSSATKTSICDNTTELIGSIRRWETLTGSEIEKLYKLNK